MDIQEAIRAAGPREVEISGWDGERVTVKLRRPSLVEMIVGDYVPNPLLGAVEKLFRANVSELTTLDRQQEARALHCIAGRALVDPTLEALEAAGVSLTDQQYMEIYAYVIGGARHIERFRRIGGGGDGQPEQPDADAGQRADGD